MDSKFTQCLQGELSEERYEYILFHSQQKLQEFVAANHEKIDCLILAHHKSVQPLFNEFHERGILLPLVLLISSEQVVESNGSTSPTAMLYYHAGEVHLSSSQLHQIKESIDSAIARFLKLAPACPSLPSPLQAEAPQSAHFLMSQQRRLAEKLQERLGYLGIYYKRDPQRFFRNLPQSEQKQLLKSLFTSYREIILDYFSDKSANQAIDEFVNRAFFADLSVSRILEIHMDLMDEFSQQLQLEGRSDEILLDYRLALIDIIAHLGEMYRRSIPREDISLEIQFPSS